MKPEKRLWIGGWGIPPNWLKKQVDHFLPSQNHEVVAPTSNAISKIEFENITHHGGYSFGAFLLLKNASKLPLPALLLAPFFAYPSEKNLGGRIKSAQILYLLRWLRRSPIEALNDFYQRAKLPISLSNELPYPLEDLEWGLHQLIHSETTLKLPENWNALLGAKDPFLESERISELEPKIQIIPEAGHNPIELLSAL